METTTVFIHEIKLKGDDEFSQKFNACSELWQRSNDQSLTEQEREKALDDWFVLRQRLELGM